MDNIGLFNRSAPLPPGYRLEQSDATSWMAFYCQQMFKIALELSRHDQAWDEMATKFLEHFLSIAQAMNTFGSHECRSWHEDDGFFYDVLVDPDGKPNTCGCARWSGCCRSSARPRCRPGSPTRCPDVTARLRGCKRRPELVGPLLSRSGPDGRQMLLSLLDPDRLRADPAAAVRRRGVPLAVRHPVAVGGLPRRIHDTVEVGGQVSIEYEPGESRTGMFGGNSNWRGPVWFPVNVLLADKLRTYGHSRRRFTIEIPTGSGTSMTLEQAADVIDTA